MAGKVNLSHFLKNDPQTREIQGVLVSVFGCQLQPHWEAAASARKSHFWPFELAVKQRGRCVLWLDRPRSHFKDPPSSYMESTHRIQEQNRGCHGDEGYGTWRALLLRTAVCSWAPVLRGPLTRQQCRKSQVLHACKCVCVCVQVDTVSAGPMGTTLGRRGGSPVYMRAGGECSLALT